LELAARLPPPIKSSTDDPAKRSAIARESNCAVIVTYHPGEAVLEIVSNVLAQVDGLVVIDNGSNPTEVALLRTAQQTLLFHLIENGRNLGVAEALNQGVRWAKSQGFRWVVLFDQDSQITDDFVEQMFAAWKGNPDRGRVGSIHSRHIVPETGDEAWVARTPDGNPVLPMTAGSMMPVWIFDKIGWFASEYFIDVVDWEYGLRTRAAGFLVIDAKQAILLHKPGAPAESRVFGHTFRPSHHNATRRYYLTRNRIAFYKKYLRIFPRWILSSAYHQFFKETIVCLIAEQDRARKFRSILLGTWDGIVGKMVSREDL
jgi:rhamnosyltransferase